MPDQFVQFWTQFEENFPDLKIVLLNILAAIAIFFIGLMIARWFKRKVNKSNFAAGRLDATLRPVVASTVFYVVIAFTIYAALRRMGVDSTGLLAVFGAAGLAIGLALKDTLGNIASGVMLLILRPVNVGEFVDTPSATGTISEIGLFNTTIKNLENVTVFLPNSDLWSQRIQNFGRHATRKLMVDVGVGYDTDLDEASQVLTDMMNAHELTLDEPDAPHVLVQSFGDSAINLSVRCWMEGANWLVNASTMRKAIKKALDEANIEIPFPQRVVTIHTDTIEAAASAPVMKRIAGTKTITDDSRDPGDKEPGSSD